MTWKQLTERDCREWKLSAVDPHDRHTWRSGVRSAMRAANQLPGRGPLIYCTLIKNDDDDMMMVMMMVVMILRMLIGFYIDARCLETHCFTSRPISMCLSIVTQNIKCCLIH